jgi:hypothetical protein
MAGGVAEFTLPSAADAYRSGAASAAVAVEAVFDAGGALGLYGMMLPRFAELAGGVALRVPAIWPVVVGVNAGASVLGYEPGVALAVVEALAVCPGTNAGAALATCGAAPFISDCLARSEGSCGAVCAIAVDSAALSDFHQASLGVGCGNRAGEGLKILLLASSASR